MEAASLALNPFLSSRWNARSSVELGGFIPADDLAVEAPAFPAKLVLRSCNTDKAELSNFIIFLCSAQTVMLMLMWICRTKNKAQLNVPFTVYFLGY